MSEHTYESRKLPLGHTIDFIGIRLMENGDKVLELVIKESALNNNKCGLKKGEVYDWLFECAVLIARQEEGKNPKRYVLHSYDIRNGELRTEIGKLERHEL